MSEPKQVIVIRKDLKMRRGKEIAQGAHASMMWLRKWTIDVQGEDVVGVSKVQLEWLEEGYAKVVCQVDSEIELLALHKAALASGLTSYLVTDFGRTEFNGVQTLTALAIGPDYPEKIDPITGHLKLY